MRWYPSSGVSRRVDLMVVVHEIGMELVGLAGHETVEPFEATAERPPLPGRAHRHLRRRREVPLADGERRVAVPEEDLREEAVAAWDRRVVAGEAGGELDDARHPADVVVASGQQARSGGRAQRRRVEVAVPQPAAGEPVERRSGDVRTEATELRIADVVEQHHDHVRRARWRGRQRRPPRCRVLQASADDPLELSRFHVNPQSPTETNCM